jgi:glycosyltransferase involved in cell wall biosynthesis
MRLAEALNIPFTIKARGADIHHWSTDLTCKAEILAAADKAAALLCVSHALKADMVALGMAADKIAVHYTGLDQEKFKPVDRQAVKTELGVSGPLFICTGALIARKKQDLAIEALTHFPDATLMLAGQGEKENEYRALATQLGIADRVQFLGNIAHDQLPRFVAAADISILVSESEGLANAWVEALSCGTPVIISEAGGARELVKSDLAGYVVERNTPALDDAITAILAKQPSQSKHRNLVIADTWANNGDQLLKQFQNVTTV